MKSYIGLTFALIFVLFLGASESIAGPFARRGGGSSGGCSGGSCGSSGIGSTSGLESFGISAGAGAVSADVYTWTAVPENPNQMALMLGSKQFGVYDFSLKLYGALQADGSWKYGAWCPVNLPAKPMPVPVPPGPYAPAPKKSLIRTDHPGCVECCCGCSQGRPCNCAAVAQR